MCKWIAKKYLMSKVNDLLEDCRGSVDKFRAAAAKWVGRLRNVLSCLETALAKLDDGRLDQEEVKQTVDAVRELVKEW